MGEVSISRLSSTATVEGIDVVLRMHLRSTTILTSCSLPRTCTPEGGR